MIGAELLQRIVGLRGLDERVIRLHIAIAIA